MIIGIDGNEANVAKRVGSNEYAYQILKHIYQSKNIDLEFIIYLKNPPLIDLPQEKKGWKYRVLRPGFLWTQWRLPLELILNRGKINLFFTPGHYGPRFCPVPLVISIMDLAFLRYPDHFKKKDLYTLVNWTKRSVNQADHILAISEFTKNEINYFYNYPNERVTITYPGIKKVINQGDSRILTKHKLKKEKYFLYLGTLQPRKNLIRLIEAFDKLRLSDKEFKLVIAGKKGWLYNQIFEKVKELKLKNKVIFTGYISEKEKTALLKNTLAFILPSLYEGFGIPVLEAMALSCPVVVSRSSSLPEVGGKAATYIDNPQSINSIQKAILKVVKLKSKERKDLIAKGLEQVKKFSWQKAGQQTLAILQKIGD